MLNKPFYIVLSPEGEDMVINESPMRYSRTEDDIIERLTDIGLDDIDGFEIWQINHDSAPVNVTEDIMSTLFTKWRDGRYMEELEDAPQVFRDMFNDDICEQIAEIVRSRRYQRKD